MTPIPHHLIYQFTLRTLQSKYRGSWLGLGWAFLSPLIMLGAYTLVFHGIFSLKWPGSATNSPLEFALFLFAGLLVFQAFSETLGRSPDAIASQPNLVTKVVFPVWVLPLSLVLSVLAQTAIGLAIYLLVLLITIGASWSWLWLPIIWLPFTLGLVGIAWLLSAVGIYVRDLGQLTSMLATFLMFLSPVFYPMTAVPEEWRAVFELNPLASAMETLRTCLLLSQTPNPGQLLYLWGQGMFWFVAGGWVFSKLRKGFADVL